MNAELPATPTGIQNAPDDFRRLFFVHVGAVVLTAALVVPLLLEITSIPSWLSVAYCVVIAAVAIAFNVAAMRIVGHRRGMRLCLALTLGLSLAQVIFILPVIVCIYAPTFRA